MSLIAQRATRIKPSPTIAVSTRAQEMKAAGRPVINLGSGEPDFDTPAHIKQAAIAAIDAGKTKYTAVGGTAALKQAVVGKFAEENGLHYSPTQIIVSTGAKQCIMNLMLAVLDAGDEIVIPSPYWVSYPDMALLADAKPVIVAAAENHKITATALSAALSEKTKLVLFNSPSNPSGALYSAAEWAALGEVLATRAPNAIIISDDIYEHILYNGEQFSNILNVCPDLQGRTVIVNGVSKAYAMTGWRIGYAAGPESVIKAMTKIQSQSTSNPCSVAQAAAQAALESGVDCVAPMIKAFDRRRRFVTAALNEMPGVECDNITGAFYAFPNAGEAIQRAAENGNIAAATDLAFCEYILEKAEVAVVPGSAFGREGYFRLSFATSDDNLQTAMARLQRLLSAAD